MTQERKAIEQAAALRNCSDRGSCVRCPLYDYVGSCADKLKQDAAEMIEDQQAVIQALAGQVSKMIADIQRLRDKYSGEAQ